MMVGWELIGGGVRRLVVASVGRHASSALLALLVVPVVCSVLVLRTSETTPSVTTKNAVLDNRALALVSNWLVVPHAAVAWRRMFP